MELWRLPFDPSEQVCQVNTLHIFLPTRPCKAIILSLGVDIEMI